MNNNNNKKITGKWEKLQQYEIWLYIKKILKWGVMFRLHPYRYWYHGYEMSTVMKSLLTVIQKFFFQGDKLLFCTLTLLNPR